MTKQLIKAPSVGESITEVSILKWLKQDGETVRAGELLLEIESDKATVEVVADATGILKIVQEVGRRVQVGETIGWIDPSASISHSKPNQNKKGLESDQAPQVEKAATQASSYPAGNFQMGPAARKLSTELQIDPKSITGTGKDGRVTQGDLLQTSVQKNASSQTAAINSIGTPKGTSPGTPVSSRPGERRVAMTPLRAKIAERLLHAQHTAAILTTFNEVDMTAVIQLRNQHKEAFKAKHQVALSFMSFFTLACLEALKLIPEVNASIEGRDILYHDYYDIGIAVGTERGLVVPVLRGVEKFNVLGVEKGIAELATKARNGKLSIQDMSGGTFTISNGGVYGSLLSTPILNPPQSGILGMHNIQERPIAVEGRVEIRPMMYLALSYDHRLIDGKGAVTFLVVLKDFLEHPEKLHLEFV